MPNFDMHLLESATSLSSLDLLVILASLACFDDGASLLSCTLCFSFANTVLHHFKITMRF